MFVRQRSTASPLLITLITIAIASVEAQQNCVTPLIPGFDGCSSCNQTLNYFLALNVSSGAQTCINTEGCIAVDANNNCVTCNGSTVLETKTNTCVILHGCKVAIAPSNCSECYTPSYYLSGGSCVLQIIDYCWRANVTCLECSDQNIINKSNCSIPSSSCLTFDYEIWQCEKCNPNQTLHSSGIFCFNLIQNCMVYQLSICIQCQQAYYLSADSKTCLDGYSINLYQQVLTTPYYLTTASLPKTLTSCLNINQDFISSNCTAHNYCINGTCTQCVPTYYLTNKLCRPCSEYTNCLKCDLLNCKQCSDGYFLVVDLGFYQISQFFTNSAISALVSSQCLPCSIYSCASCRNQFTDNNINKVRCDRCLFGYKLFNYTCYKCEDGSYFNITTKACLSCNDSLCQICNTDPNVCDQCQTGYFWNGTNCLDINTSYYSSPSGLKGYYTFQVFNKSFPQSSTEIVNDEILLIESCSGKSNGYVCLCPNNGTVFTSLCYSINKNLTTVNTTVADIGSTLGLNSTNLNKAQFVPNLILWKLMSQLPNFSVDYLPASGDLLSEKQFASYIQMKVNYIRNHYQYASAQALAIANFTFNSQFNVFSPYSPTVISGPGYYFKYSPSTSQLDDSSFVTISQINSNQSSVVFVLFNNTVTSIKAITGYVYVFLGSLNASSNVTLKVKKIGFLESYQSYLVQANGISQSLNVTSDSQGFLTISNVTSSTVSTQFVYFVTVSNGTSAGDIYATTRIQNLIYRDSFIYILIIFSLYFVFVPLCFLVDCVDKKAFKRKVPKEEEGSSYQGIKHKTESDNAQAGEDQRIQKIYINYKDFFPIYNIANTPKPKRILKLCLFIVNIQHSITFLSLIYFHLSAGQPLVAVLLAIPAYICTIILGYLCGLITLKLPGNTKYLINILTIVYWVIWVVVMADFYSNEYKPYVYTFVVIFFVVDMLFDFLQTLLMYFTIKQDTRQIKLFKALSKWLSFRGYYEFDEMAKDLAQARDNQ